MWTGKERGLSPFEQKKVDKRDRYPVIHTTESLSTFRVVLLGFGFVLGEMSIKILRTLGLMKGKSINNHSLKKGCCCFFVVNGYF